MAIHDAYDVVPGLMQHHDIHLSRVAARKLVMESVDRFDAYVEPMRPDLVGHMGGCMNVDDYESSPDQRFITARGSQKKLQVQRLSWEWKRFMVRAITWPRVIALA